MPSIELTAKSLDQAKTDAAAKLGVSADQVTITVLEETKGLFGKTNLRVRAEAADPAPEPAAKPAKAPRGKKAAAVEAVVEAPVEEEAVVEAAPEPAAKPARGRGRKADAPAAAAATTERAPMAEGDTQATQEDADHFLGVLNGMLKKTGLEIEASSTGYSGRYVNVHFDGEDTGYLVGKHGEVLNSFQYLTNIIAAQQWGNGVRCVLDGNDFRSRREEQLTHLATKIAEQVSKRGEEAVLDALPAFERRIVHKALSEMAGITTYSEGEEPNRRVVIAPAE